MRREHWGVLTGKGWADREALGKREGGEHGEMRLPGDMNVVKDQSAKLEFPGRLLQRSYFGGTLKAEVRWQWVSRRR